MTNEQRISSAVDLLTVVIEDEQEDITIRRQCGAARDQAVNALIDVRVERTAYERTPEEAA